MEESVRAKVLTRQAQESSSHGKMIGIPATIKGYGDKKRAHDNQESHDLSEQDIEITGTTENRNTVSFLCRLPCRFKCRTVL